MLGEQSMSSASRPAVRHYENLHYILLLSLLLLLLLPQAHRQPRRSAWEKGCPEGMRPNRPVGIRMPKERKKALETRLYATNEVSKVAFTHYSLIFIGKPIGIKPKSNRQSGTGAGWTFVVS